MIHAFKTADLRVSLGLMAFNSVILMFCSNEILFMLLLLVACFWLVFRGKPLKAVKFYVLYLALWWLSGLIIGVKSLTTVWLFTNILRHILIPISYADGLSDAPTGTLLAVFGKLGLPKSVGISTAVLLRFLPTLGGEFRSIRRSLKFRNTGTGILNTLSHIPSNFERTMVPLLIRVTRIADELSAAAMVRGVRMTNRIISFEEVSFKRRDLLITLSFSAVSLTLCIAGAFFPEVA